MRYGMWELVLWRDQYNQTRNLIEPVMLTKKDQEVAIRLILYNQAAIMEALANLCSKDFANMRDKLRFKSDDVRLWLEYRVK